LADIMRMPENVPSSARLYVARVSPSTSRRALKLTGWRTDWLAQNAVLRSPKTEQGQRGLALWVSDGKRGLIDLEAFLVNGRVAFDDDVLLGHRF
jgi:hypothetical protein